MVKIPRTRFFRLLTGKTRLGGGMHCTVPVLLVSRVTVNLSHTIVSSWTTLPYIWVKGQFVQCPGTAQTHARICDYSTWTTIGNDDDDANT